MIETQLSLKRIMDWQSNGLVISIIVQENRFTLYKHYIYTYICHVFVVLNLKIIKFVFIYYRTRIYLTRIHFIYAI